MTDDRWKSLNRRLVSTEELNDAVGIGEEPDWRDPFTTVVTFINALDDPHEYVGPLEMLTTPESRAAWGDFTDAASLLRSIDDWGLGSAPTPAEGDDSVRYAKVLRGVQNNFQVQAEQIIFVAAMVTLVWREEVGMWLVHAFGEPVPPELVPHSGK